MKKYDQATQITALTLLARGDTVAEVSEQLSMVPSTVVAIKKRNSEMLTAIKKKHLEKRIHSAGKILDKANRLIDRRLTQAEHDETEKNVLLEQYRNGEIEYKEYQQKVFGLVELSLNDLSNVSGKMQDQIKKNESENSNETDPAETKEQMQKLMEAIKDGDPVILERMVFGSKTVEAGN